MCDFGAFGAGFILSVVLQTVVIKGFMRFACLAVGVANAPPAAKTWCGSPQVTKPMSSSRVLTLLGGSLIAMGASAIALADEPTVSFTVEQFNALVTADEAAAKRQYGDKLIELTGTIWSMGVESEGVARVTFSGNKAACFVSGSQPWKDFGEGQKVTVRGVYTRRIFGVGLERCTLTPVDDSPLIRRTAADLAREFQQDLAAAGDKYHDQQFVVTGKVASVERDKRGPTEIFLEGADGMQISCAFAFDLERQLRDVEAGQQFTCYGKFLRVLGTEKEVGLIDCLPIEEAEIPKVEPGDPFAGWSASKARTWTNRSGKTVEAEFVSLTDETVRLKRKSDGKLFDFPLAKLSDADQAYARERGPRTIARITEPLAEAAESDKYTLVLSPENASAIATEANALLTRAGGRTTIGQSARTLEEVLAGLKKSIAEMERLGISWSHDEVFNPQQPVYAAALKNNFQGKEYRMYLFSNSAEFKSSAVAVYPDRVYGKDRWVVTGLREK